MRALLAFAVYAGSFVPDDLGNRFELSVLIDRKCCQAAGPVVSGKQTAVCPVNAEITGQVASGMLLIEQRKGAGSGIDGVRLDAAPRSAVEFVHGACRVQETAAGVGGEEEGIVNVRYLRHGFEFAGRGIEIENVQAFGTVVRIGANVDRDVSAGLI